MNHDQIVQHMEASQEYQRRLDMIRNAYARCFAAEADKDGLWWLAIRG